MKCQARFPKVSFGNQDNMSFKNNNGNLLHIHWDIFPSIYNIVTVDTYWINMFGTGEQKCYDIQVIGQNR